MKCRIWGPVLAVATTATGILLVAGPAPVILMGVATAGALFLAGAWPPLDVEASAAMTLMPSWAEVMLGVSCLVGGALATISWWPRMPASTAWTLRRTGIIAATPGLAGYALIVATAPAHASVVAAALTCAVLAGLWVTAAQSWRDEARIRAALKDAALEVDDD